MKTGRGYDVLRNSTAALTQNRGVDTDTKTPINQCRKKLAVIKNMLTGTRSFKKEKSPHRTHSEKVTEHVS